MEAAETTAADIQGQAEEDAQAILGEANAEAQSTREHATQQAREYVGRVSESTAVMLQRLDAMESELGALIESLRTGANRLNADLQLLEGNLTELKDTAAPRPTFEPEEHGGYGSAAPDPYETARVEPEPVYAEPEPEPEPEPPRAEPEPEYEEEIEEATAVYAEPEPAGEGSDDTEGARLIALNMALNGTPREETDRYLAANFDLDDRAALLDEVYASVEG